MKDGQITIRLRVINAGTVRATYKVVLKGVAPAFNRQTSAVIDGSAGTIVEIAIDTRGIKPGQYPVTATLSSDLQTIELSTDSTTVQIAPV